MHPTPTSRLNSAPYSTADVCTTAPDTSRAARFGLLLIRGYKLLLSPLLGGSCRFMPGCAEYAAEAIEKYGLFRGSWLGLRRLGRCHPLGGHGYDPVPHRLRPR